MYLIWLYGSDWDNFFNFCDTYLSSCSNILVEISSRFSKLKISSFVSSPSLNESKIANNRLFKKIILASELLYFSWS